MFGEHRQQVELALGQVDVGAVDPGPSAGDVDLQRPHVDGLRGGRGGGAPAAQQRLHPGHQFGQNEWLHQVVIGAGLQARHPIVHRTAGREHTHRHVVVHRAQRGHHADPVEHGHIDIQHDRIGPGLGGAAQGLGTVDGGEDLEARQSQAALQ